MCHCHHQIRHIFAGSSYSLAVSVSRHTYFCGILPNSPRGEACTYPRIVQELHDYPAALVGGGASWVMVASHAPASAASNCTDVIFWGTPAAGKFGLEADARSSANPKFVAATDGLRVTSLVCGYGHCCSVVRRAVGQSEESFCQKMQGFPELGMESQEARAGADGAAVAGTGKEKAAGKGKGKAAAQAVVAGKRKKEPAAAAGSAAGGAKKAKASGKKK